MRVPRSHVSVQADAVSGQLRLALALSRCAVLPLLWDVSGSHWVHFSTYFRLVRSNLTPAASLCVPLGFMQHNSRVTRLARLPYDIEEETDVARVTRNLGRFVEAHVSTNGHDCVRATGNMFKDLGAQAAEQWATMEKVRRRAHKRCGQPRP